MSSTLDSETGSSSMRSETNEVAFGGNQEVASKNEASLNSEWFQNAYHSAVEFYEKDKVLNPKDRLELSQIYLSISRAQVWGGWIGFALVFGVPFAHRLYKTGAIRGVNVKRNFVLGLGTMLGSTYLSGSYMYKRKMESIKPLTMETDPTVEKTSQQKQYEMMKLLDGGMPGRWALYFYNSYRNPERRIRDPKKKMEELQAGNTSLRTTPAVFDNRDPMGLYSGPQFDKKEGVVNLDQDEKHEGFPGSDASDSSWDRIRQQNDSANSIEGNSWDQVRKQNSEHTESND